MIKHRSHLVALAVVSASLIALCPGIAAAATEGPHNSFFDAATNWGPEDLVIPRFDEMGGTRVLTKVTVDWVASVDGSIQFENLDGSPSVLAGTLAALITIDGPAGFSVVTTPSDMRVFKAAPFDGTPDFDGPSGATFPDLDASDSAQLVFTSFVDLDQFIGTGDVFFTASASNQSFTTGSGNMTSILLINASASVSVTYEFDNVPSDPDTYLVLFDTNNNIINEDDNSSSTGNGWASGLFAVTAANGIIDDGDGARSIRIGVTGRPDGLDGTFNGYFLTQPHNQFGDIMLFVDFYDGIGVLISSKTSPAKFIIGAEAFRINYKVPASAASVDIYIDNALREQFTPTDINNDGIVDTADLGTLIGNFGMMGP